jgi:maltose-binding protein MalE
MLRKARFILVLISLSVCLGLMSTTYSRYVASATGNIDVLFAKWQILVNNTDVTSNSNSVITFTPVIEQNNNIKANVVAPSSKGYFDIDIDPTNVDVSFKYTINLGIENGNIPDLMITKYAIIPDTYVEGDILEVINLNGSPITGTLNFDNSTSSFQFKPFTIRVFFEWYEGVNELMGDEADTAIGNSAATGNTTFKMNANVSFEQVFE